MNVAGASIDSSVDIFFPYDTADGALTSIDTMAYVMPSSWLGIAPAPFSNNGWDAFVQQNDGPGGSTTHVGMTYDGDAFGTAVCPATDNDPLADPPPAFIIRIGGQTQAGPFTSEVFVPICYRL